MKKRYYIDRNGIKELYIKVGDKFVTKYPGNLFDVCILTVTSIDGKGMDSIVHFNTDKKVGGKEKHSAKYWWFCDYTILLR